MNYHSKAVRVMLVVISKKITNIIVINDSNKRKHLKLFLTKIATAT